MGMAEEVETLCCCSMLSSLRLRYGMSISPLLTGDKVPARGPDDGRRGVPTTAGLPSGTGCSTRSCSRWNKQAQKSKPWKLWPWPGARPRGRRGGSGGGPGRGGGGSSPIWRKAKRFSTSASSCETSWSSSLPWKWASGAWSESSLWIWFHHACASSLLPEPKGCKNRKMMDQIKIWCRAKENGKCDKMGPGNSRFGGRSRSRWSVEVGASEKLVTGSTFLSAFLVLLRVQRWVCFKVEGVEREKLWGSMVKGV